MDDEALLNQWVEKCGGNQKKAAWQLGVSPSRFNNWYRAGLPAPIRRLMAEVLDLPPVIREEPAPYGVIPLEIFEALDRMAAAVEALAAAIEDARKALGAATRRKKGRE